MGKAPFALFALALLAVMPLTAQDATTEPSPAATIDVIATTEPIATMDVTTEAGPAATMDVTTEAGPVATQDMSQPTMDMSKVVVGGLHNPRNIFLSGADVYIAEAGTGGPNTIDTEFGPLNVGGGGQITRVRDGVASPFILNLFSSVSESGEATGPHDVYVNENSAWVLVGQGIPTANVEFPTFALVSFSADGVTQGNVIDLYANETANNPDGGVIDSNPVDFTVAPDGTIYVADAGANAVLRVGTDGVVSTFAAWPVVAGQPEAVPTAVELDDAGNLYVGFLTGGPFPVGGAWIEELDPTGASIHRYNGLTMVVDIELSDAGDLYAVEFGQFGQQGPVFNSGRIVRVTDSGIEPVVTGLNFPYGMAIRPDGSFYVVNNASFAPEGQLLWVSEGDDLTPVMTDPTTMGTAEPGTQATLEATLDAPAATMDATSDVPMATVEVTSDVPAATMDATSDVPVATMEVTSDVPVATAEATSAP